MLESILYLFNTTGLIFGPLICLSGIFSLYLCFQAARSPSEKFKNRLFLLSFLPFYISLFGSMVGYMVLLNHGGINSIQIENWLALGKCCLAGLAVSSAPLFWSIFLYYRQAKNS
jgi:ABC-type spermidine/putrescine transport system permease subunit I